MLALRRQESAFSPNSPQQILKMDDRIFALIRGEGNNQIMILINVSCQLVECRTGVEGINLFNGSPALDDIFLEPYGYTWIRLRV